MQATQGAEGGEADEDRGRREEPDANVVTRRGRDLSFGTHPGDDRIEREPDARRADTGEKHGEHERSVRVSTDGRTIAGPVGARDLRLRADTEEAEDPEGAREECRRDTERRRGALAELRDEVRVDEARERLGDERDENSSRKSEQRAVRMSVESMCGARQGGPEITIQPELCNVGPAAALNARCGRRYTWGIVREAFGFDL